MQQLGRRAAIEVVDNKEHASGPPPRFKDPPGKERKAPSDCNCDSQPKIRPTLRLKPRMDEPQSRRTDDPPDNYEERANTPAANAERERHPTVEKCAQIPSN